MESVVAVTRGDVLDSLEDLGYDGPLIEDEAAFKQAVDDGPSSPKFTTLVSWLVQGLSKLSSIDATVAATSSAEEAESFELELSGLLSELHCPYTALVEGEMINRFGNKQNRLRLLDFLTSELQAAKIIASRPQKVEAMEVDKECGWHISSQHLKNICMSLELSKPPPNVNEVQLFNKIEECVRKRLSSRGSEGVGKPILKQQLTEQQWAKLGKINERMRKEYSLRRQMLLKRLDVTIQSFQWGERMKGKMQDKLASAYRPKRSKLALDSQVTIATLMAAREDLAKLRKTSSGSVRKNTKSAINKVLMGHVPDRGGRPLEATPPPVEMPAFRQRTEQPKGQRPQSGRGGRVQGGWSGGDGGGRGGARGGRGGGWNQGSGHQQGGSGYQQGGFQQGGYQQGGYPQGGYQQGGFQQGGFQQGGYQGGGGYQQGGSGFQQGGHQPGGYQQGGYQQGGGGRGHRGGMGKRGGKGGRY